MNEPRVDGPALRASFGETLRYVAASGLALGVDFGVYVFLIRQAGVDYLVAAPIGFTLGLTVIYALSVRWVFGTRRLANSQLEFSIFASIGLAGLALNQIIVFVGVEWLAFSYELAKLASAAIVFGFNFLARKLILFTRY
jgi:putative flippase GtrA